MHISCTLSTFIYWHYSVSSNVSRLWALKRGTGPGLICSFEWFIWISMASSLFNPNQDNSTNSKKAKRILCGRFSRISTKLPRIPLRRQKLPKVVGKLQNSFSYPTAVLSEAALVYVISLPGACTTQFAEVASSVKKVASFFTLLIANAKLT